MKEIIKSKIELLEDEELLQLFNEANGYDGSFEFSCYYTLDDLCDIMDAYSLAKAIIWGDVKNIIDPLCFNGNGNLKTTTYYTLFEECHYYIDALIDWLENNYMHIDYEFYGFELCDFGD